MALTNLPDNGLVTFYADESDDKQTYVISCVAVPTLGALRDEVPVRWDDFFERTKAWRRGLRDRYGIPLGKELKGSKLATGRNSYQPNQGRLFGQRAVDAYAFALRTLDFMPPGSIFSVTCERDYRLYGHTRLEAVLYAMFQRMQKKCEVDRTIALIFFDEGHGEYRRLYRKSRQHLPTGSQQGAWSDGSSSRSIPFSRALKDANFKDSKQSHFIQIADLVAYATLMKMRAEQSRLSEREEAQQVAKLHDAIPRRILNTFVDRKTTDGIKRLR